MIRFVFGNTWSELTNSNKGSQWSASSNMGADVSLKEFRQYLQERVDEAKGVNALARQMGVSASQISKVLNGAVPGDDFLSVFGFKRRITIVKK